MGPAAHRHHSLIPRWAARKEAYVYRSMDLNRTFCSRQARQADTSLAGTATEATRWLLVEVPAPWGGKALAESDLPPDVKSHLFAWEGGADNRRVQFIRRETNAFDARGRITVLLASVSSPLTSTDSPALHTLHLNDYGDILNVDLERLAGRPLPSKGTSHSEPIFLTCTNGRRDACCAKWGRAMAEALSAAAGDQAWQTTHLGGHRFAPTLLVLPHGSQYGWLEPDDAGPLVEAHRRERLYRLDRYRGHVGFTRPVQAAAAFLRETIDCQALGALSVVHAAMDDETSRVRLRVGTETYDVQILHEEGETMALSCGATPEPTERLTPIGYRVV